MLGLAGSRADTKLVTKSQQLEYIGAEPTWSPWYKGYKLMWNIRGIGTPWENPYLWPGIKHTWDAPKSSTDIRKAHGAQTGSRHNLTVRGRWSGVAIRCGYMLLNFFLLACLYEFVNPEYLLNAGPSDFSPEKERIIRRFLQTFLGQGLTTPVTRHEFGVRAISAFENAAGNFLLFSLYHDVCAIFFIGIGLDESWEWPPFFGQVTEAYTMRRWYVTPRYKVDVSLDRERNVIPLALLRHL
ncbi:hypothetical protein P280DRAFT_532822 [Massarina eburnea CBS 473.64]|uniref:Wax synthase domain-containing protein n=1 Tax=Massarina eburnea CBS 473.64 TaxID=1395130 RepID=A0A6A6RMZ7_9PLEO|nr:hypothetical protein P280DRAFT_532822 [Massarina eburnea CBS 473.64]